MKYVKMPPCWAGWIKSKTFIEAGVALADGDKNPAGNLITEWAKCAVQAEDAGQELFVLRLPKDRAIYLISEIQKMIDERKE